MSIDHHPLRFLQYMRSYIVQKVIEHSFRHISQRFCNHRVANVYILQIQYHISFTWQKKVSSRLSSVYWILGVDCCTFECTNVAAPLDIYEIEILSSLFPPSLFNLHISSKHFIFRLFFFISSTYWNLSSISSIKVNLQNRHSPKAWIGTYIVGGYVGYWNLQLYIAVGETLWRKRYVWNR